MFEFTVQMVTCKIDTDSYIIKIGDYMENLENVLDGRRLRSIKTRNKIIAAAHHVFLKEGFKNTTIKQIIKQADVGYGTAYSHFNGKDELLIVLMEDVMNLFFEVARIPFFPESKEDAREIIYSQVFSFIQIADDERGIMSVFLEAIGLSSPISEKWEKIRSRLIQSIIKDVIYSQMKGLARKDLKAELVARSWFYSNEMYQMEIVTSEENYNLQEVAHTLTTMYIDAIYI